MAACLALGGLFAFLPAFAQEGSSAESLLVVVGDPMPAVRFGHEDHCTGMQEIDRGSGGKVSRLNVILAANTQNWISLVGEVKGGKCESVTSLVPLAGVGYIAKLSKLSCNTELFQARKGEAPLLIKTGNESMMKTLLCAASTGPADQAGVMCGA